MSAHNNLTIAFSTTLTRALGTKRFSASALAQVLFFDVVAGVALGVVVMDILLNR